MNSIGTAPPRWDGETFRCQHCGVELETYDGRQLPCWYYRCDRYRSLGERALVMAAVDGALVALEALS